MAASDTCVITLMSEKGGVGKTFLAREIAASFERTGDSAAIMNIDPQYAVSIPSTDRDVIVLDTPGYISESFDAIVAASDVVVVPVRPTPANVEPFCRIVSSVRETSDVPIVIVVNAWNRNRACRTWMSWLKGWLSDEGFGDDFVVHPIPQSEAIVRAEFGSRSVIDGESRGFSRGVCGCVMDAVNAVRDAAGFDADTVADDTESAFDARAILDSLLGR